ncbi:hypothetical protein BDV93DRAFT_89415 [Ceratobasidium sp. AG-I]|nr:hypothetical protein BDV93DRAFT_89415 [Ceratobasidium sp. AG-I]
MSLFNNDPACAVSPDAYESWGTARSTLYHSIKSYILASNALGSALVHSSPQRPLSRDFLQQFDTELACFLDEEQKLQSAHTALIRSRNMTESFSSISRLPVEVLSNIFLAASAYPTHNNSSNSSPLKSPQAIACVCQAWRTVALSLPSLWSYLYLSIRRPDIDGNSLKRVKLLSERSIGADLRLDIWVQIDAGDREDRDEREAYVTEITIEKLIPVLAPLASRVRHLEIGMSVDSQNFLQSLLACLIGLGASSSIHHLDLWYDPDWILFGASDSRLDLLPWEGSYQPGHWEDESPVGDLLKSVSCLRLRSINIPGNDEAYHALTELSLCDIDLSIQELESILEASPMLHTLSLTRLELDYEGAPTNLISLPHLQSLTLDEVSPKTTRIFALLEPGVHSLHVHLSLKIVDSSMVGDIQGCFGRSNVTNLHIKITEPNRWFSLSRLSLGQLETLTLERCNIWDSDLVDFLASDETRHTLHKAPL